MRSSGSGLGPILALADGALRRGFPHQTTLIFSARTSADVFDQGLLRWWERKHRKFRSIVTLTGPHRLLQRIQDELGRH